MTQTHNILSEEKHVALALCPEEQLQALPQALVSLQTKDSAVSRRAWKSGDRKINPPDVYVLSQLDFHLLQP